jgi:chorismate mutase
MRLNMKTRAFIAVWTICAQVRAYPQNATDRLQPLVEASAQRLVIAEQVALAKWDSGTAVEDTSREAQVIASAVTAGESKGLDPAVVSNFFRAQVDANKLVQYSLLAEWRRLGRAPDHKPVNLAGTIRRELDQLGTELIAELTETAALRASPSCPTDIAKAVGKYASAHKNSFDSLKAIALDRAMAAACNVGGNSK